MKRDMDLIRAILLNVEARREPFTQKPHFAFIHDDRDLVAYTMGLLVRQKLLTGQLWSTMQSHPADDWHDVNLTWEGHDFLDSVRDPEIWRRTKDGAKAAGGFSFDLMKALAKGLLKKKIEQHTGVELDL